MSGIGSIGGSSAAQYLRKLSSSSSCTDSQSVDDSTDQDELEQDIQAAGSTVDYSTLRSQIEDALKTALSGTTSASDPSETAKKIKDAIAGTLQAAGIDPAKLKDALAADFGAPQAGGQPPAGGPPHGAKAEGQDLFALLDAISSSDDNDDANSTLDALLGGDGSTGAGGGTPDLGAILDGTDSSSDPFGLIDSSSSSGSSSSSSNDWLSQLYNQLFKNFPNGSGLDTTA